MSAIARCTIIITWLCWLSIVRFKNLAILKNLFAKSFLKTYQWKLYPLKISSYMVAPPLPRERSESSKTFKLTRTGKKISQLELRWDVNNHNAEKNRQFACKYMLQNGWLKFKLYYAISMGAIYIRNLPHHLPAKRQVRIKWSFSECLL